jgi:diguanylate cyclase (GGDEF)-like protein
MHQSASTPDETRRQQALHALNLLDTPIEERFERITRSARQLLNMPIAAISLVDENRQWFKSVQGLEVSETPRADSFCSQAVLGNGPLIVPDATQDERFARSALVRDDPWIRFYAGYPIKAANGCAVGALCVVDRKPRRFRHKHEVILRSLARTVEVELKSKPPSEAQRALISDLSGDERRGAVDALTRLWGREAILEVLERELQHARRKGFGIGTLIVDLDRREAINGALGYEAGDTVVRKTARRLLRALRSQDSMGRFGATAFLGVVTRADRAELAALAQRMRTKIAKTPIRSAKGVVDATVSLGAAWAPASMLRTPGALLDAATYALSSAQLRGGNRVEVRAA